KAEQEANRRRAEQEAKAKKEMDRLNKEAGVKARLEAKRQLEAEAKARQQAKREPTRVESAPQPAPATTVAAPKTAPAAAPVTSTAAPVQSKTAQGAAAAGPSTTAQSKKQRLDALTDAYVHDKLNAEQYYRERSKVLAEPGE